ncbi:hypothetical protein [uncultured Hoeflea sp.]|uniref:COG3904 family protein n=1 Tax=uncultured Hoeflea sp. TaxID=538666 RepID=UPI002601BBB2|nr:hypothetical protein [uncultured Hoeflea sp.]
MRRKLKFIWFASAYIFAQSLLGSGDNASAAEILDLGECQFSIEGVIEPGDADELETVHAHQCSFNTLYLNSPGGVLSEALQIADYITRTETVIRDGDECLSACALIFMAGRGCSGAPYFCTTYRRMGKQSRLGFHAPFMSQDESDPGVLLPRNVSFAAALDMFSDIQATFSRFSAEVRSTGAKNDVFPQGLFAKMFSTPPNEFYYVTNNDQFFSLDIEIFDETNDYEIILSKHHIYYLCYNLIYSEERGWNYSVYGFEDYQNAASFDSKSIISWDIRKKTEVSFYEGSGPEYLMLFDGLNMGPSIYGHCHVQPQRGGYFSVDFVKNSSEAPLTEVDWKKIDSDTHKPDYGRLMHYSMAYPLQIPVGLFQKNNLFDPLMIDLVNSYFASIDMEPVEDNVRRSALHWVKERQETVEKQLVNICGATIINYEAAQTKGDYIVISVNAEIHSCLNKNRENFSIELYITEENGSFKISNIK